MQQRRLTMNNIIFIHVPSPKVTPELYRKGTKLSGRVRRATIVAKGYKNSSVEIRHIPIRNLHDYYADANGNIYKQYQTNNMVIYKIVTPNYSQNGKYLRVNVTAANGKRTLVEVHRLVASVFCDKGNALKKGSIYEVHHLDHDSRNNAAYNLIVLTKKQHARLHHRTRQKHAHAKISK